MPYHHVVRRSTLYTHICKQFTFCPPNVLLQKQQILTLLPTYFHKYVVIFIFEPKTHITFFLEQILIVYTNFSLIQEDSQTWPEVKINNFTKRILVIQLISTTISWQQYYVNFLFLIKNAYIWRFIVFFKHSNKPLVVFFCGS